MSRQRVKSRAIGQADRQSGQALIEMAIVIPLLLLLIFAGIDAIQIAMTNYHLSQAVEAAVHEAALVGGAGAGETREGTLSNAKGSIAQQARLILDAGLGTSAEHATIRITCLPVECPRYAAVTVELQYHGEVWAPIGPFGSFSASSKMTRATEQDRGPAASGTARPAATPVSLSFPGVGPAALNHSLNIPGALAVIPGDSPAGAGAQP